MDYFKLWMELKKQLLVRPENDNYGTQYDRQLEVLHMMDAMEVSQALDDEEPEIKNQGVAEYVKEKFPDEEPIMTIGLQGEE